MRILLTGVGCPIGRAAARHLIAAGHDVAGLSAVEDHRLLDPRVQLHLAALDDPVLQSLADDADAIVHLAPIEPGEPDSAGISGVLAVSDAAGRSGSRLLSIMPAAGDPRRHRYAAELVTSCWSPSLVIRIAPLLGRIPDPMILRTVATVRRRSSAQRIRVLHLDDLLRFLARAVGSHRTGTVDLAMPDHLELAGARRRLAGADQRLRHRASWPDPDQEYQLAPLHRDWDFDCGWAPMAAVADTARGLNFRLNPVIEAPARRTSELGPGPTELKDAVPGVQAGELDDLIDSRFPVYVASAEGTRAPLTPLALDLHAEALCAAHRAVAAALGLPAELELEWGRRATAVFGHRFYAGLSVAAAVAELLPGCPDLDTAGVGSDTALFAAGPPETPGRLGRPTVRVAVSARLLALAGRYGGECDALALDVATDGGVDVAPQDLSDAQLGVRIGLLRNRIRQGWTTTAMGLIIEDTLGPATTRRHPIVWTRSLAAAAEQLDLTTLPAGVPLRPEPADSREPEPRSPLPRRLLESARAGRQRCWQTTLDDLARLAAVTAEAGNRMADVRAVGCVADVNYLTCDELMAAPLDTRLRVKRRRADTERLAAVSMPELIGRAGADSARTAG